jgi:hypothetical protein
MTKFFFASLVLAAIPTAQAELVSGYYYGTDQNGAECLLSVSGTSYVDDFHHPMNQRTIAWVDGDDFEMSYRRVIDEESGVVTSNRGVFEGVAAQSTGAHALIVRMNLANNLDQPASFTLLKHKYQGDERQVLHCEGLAARAESTR